MLGLPLYLAAVALALAVLGRALADAVARSVTVERRLDRGVVAWGEAVEVGLTVRSRGSMPVPWVRLEEHLPDHLHAEGDVEAVLPLGRAPRHLQYTLPAPPRGLHRLGPTVIEGSDPFGLVRRFKTPGPEDGGAAEFLTVLPRLVPLDGTPPPAHRPIPERPRRSLFEDPSRFAGVRAFRHGDGLRRVHWRATARTGALQAKVFEPAAFGGLLLVLDLHQDGWQGVGGDTLELAVTTAASLAEVALRGSLDVGLFACAADAAEAEPEWGGSLLRRRPPKRVRAEAEILAPLEVPTARGPGHRSTLLEALARATPARGPRLGRMLHAEQRRLPRSALVVVITPGGDPALGAAVSAVRRGGGEARVLLVGDAEAGDLGLVRRIRDRSDLARLAVERL